MERGARELIYYMNRGGESGEIGNENRFMNEA